MKTLGIIGGFGPEATAQFYLKLIDASRLRNHGLQPHVIMHNCAVPQELEHNALMLGKGIDKFIPILTKAAHALENAHADMVVLPCNTLHVHEQAIRSALTIPFISIIDATTQFLHQNKVQKIGFLGSRVTVKENLFAKKTPSVSFVTVPRSFQRSIDRGLDRFVATQDGSELTTSLKHAFAFLETKGVGHVLLACTDFHGLCPKTTKMRVHDTLDILVRASLDVL